MRLFAGIIALVLLWTPLSRAEPGGAESVVDWDAPDDCVSLGELRQLVAEQSPAGASYDRRVSGVATAAPGGYRATLSVSEGDGVVGARELELAGDDCRAHDETLALVVVLLLEHGPPEPQPEPELAAEQREPEADPAPTPAAEAEPMSLRVAAGVAGLAGFSPRFAVGPTVAVGVDFVDAVRLELQGDFYPATSSSEVDGGSIKASGGRAHLRGCSLLPGGALRAAGCVGGGWLAVSAEGRGGDMNSSAFFGSGEAGVDLLGWWVLSERLALQAEANLMIPFRMGTFSFMRAAEEVQVYETRRIVGGARVGLVLTF